MTKAGKKAAFNYDLDFRKINFRERPDLYRVGKGEQGVLLVEPYKTEILPHWRFKTPEIAAESSAKITELFEQYLEKEDFVGADMARKFLQMGYTRSRRYANHRSGKKYDGPVPENKKGQSGAHGREILPNEEDPVKAASAAIFKESWHKAKENKKYKELLAEFRQKYEQSEST
ncbi:DUF4385 domain-containing protein [Pontibacter akesuensis]|uniref:DUF4385 domain-containing protein n=1 Tax=Pontibacter akesuensis TaxID=388950 RepID=A0A1I7I107_9BACT|nr:DUF4385 domain-containing protein [Pontibacter akesuensis]GHA64635.1 hypothetical protein GCM10007389_16690 [Pontibacter akesuensis]SFU66628.1 protein of unknown function [Pontibacter akesuensis]